MIFACEIMLLHCFSPNCLPVIDYRPLLEIAVLDRSCVLREVEILRPLEKSFSPDIFCQ